MAKTVELRPLARDDDRSGFSCGKADLDRFFDGVREGLLDGEPSPMILAIGTIAPLVET